MTCRARLFFVLHPLPTDGFWLKHYNPEAHDGRGEIVLTADRKLGKQFASPYEAQELWNAVPGCHPLRSDGQPNKPLTAYHMMIVDDDLPYSEAARDFLEQTDTATLIAANATYVQCWKLVK